MQMPPVLGTSGKIIKSGPEDRVFVYFADHGAPGILAITLVCLTPMLHGSSPFKQIAHASLSFLAMCEGWHFHTP